MVNAPNLLATPRQRFSVMLFVTFHVLAALNSSALAEDSAALRASAPPPGAIWIESLGLDKMTQRRGRPRAGQSIRDAPISLGGLTYPHGIGTRSISEFVIDLHGSASRFAAMVGLDDAVTTGVGTVVFEVWADDVLVASSGLIRAGEPPKLLSAELTGARVLTLLLDDGGDTSNDDEGAWGGAVLYLQQDASPGPAAYVVPPDSPPAIAPARDLPQPAIHGPRIVGATPGRPFLFRMSSARR
ncbi:MAG TPA: NPCBM/NEW2 domain-containing protein [Steroidobacteraceae bacterium]|jgi:alpha-galactosidase